MKLTYRYIRVVILCATSVLMLSGCLATKKNTYHWGDYESLIYKMYADTENATTDIQIERLERDIKETQKRGRKTPPGVYAHLGFIYASTGNSELAIEAFNQEKNLFPESVKFIDGMMDRAFKRNKS